MKVRLNFIVRILGMGALAYVGNSLGRILSSPQPSQTEELATQLLTLAGAGLGLLTTHRWTLDPLREGLRYIKSISISELTAILFGALLGLVFAALLAIPLARLPDPLGQFLPVIAAALLAYLGGIIFSARKKEIGDLLRSSRRSPLMLPPGSFDSMQEAHRYILDTSAIIDGRIANVAQAGFIE